MMFHAMLAVAFIGSAWVSRLHSGAYDNVLIPAYVYLSMVVGLAMSEIPDRASSENLVSAPPGCSLLSAVEPPEV
jgi:hypothetical protein